MRLGSLTVACMGIAVSVFRFDGCCTAEGVPVPNPSFEEGAGQPSNSNRIPYLYESSYGARLPQSSTDDGILHRGKDVPNIEIIDPPSLIRELEP